MDIQLYGMPGGKCWIWGTRETCFASRRATSRLWQTGAHLFLIYNLSQKQVTMFCMTQLEICTDYSFTIACHICILSSELLNGTEKTENLIMVTKLSFNTVKRSPSCIVWSILVQCCNWVWCLKIILLEFSTHSRAGIGWDDILLLYLKLKDYKGDRRRVECIAQINILVVCTAIEAISPLLFWQCFVVRNPNK